MLKALTLAQPWALKFEIGALVENRDWQPSAEHFGRVIALHGGKSKSYNAIKQDLDFVLEKLDEQIAPEWLLNQIRWRNEHKDNAVFARDVQVEGIFGLARLNRVVTSRDELDSDQAPWFFGRFGWVFSSYFSFDNPVPCVGSLGLWDVGANTLELVKEEFASSKRNKEWFKGLA